MQTHPDLAGELGGINNAGSLHSFSLHLEVVTSPPSNHTTQTYIIDRCFKHHKSVPNSLMGAHIQQELKLARNSLMGTRVQELNILSPRSSLTL